MDKLDIIHALDYASLENLGGDCRVAFEVSAALAEMGHRPAVFGGCENPKGETAWRGVRIANFPYDPSAPGVFRKFNAVGRSSARRFVEIFGEKKFHAAVFHQPLVARAFRKARLLKNLPRVYYFHSPWHMEFEAAGGGRGLSWFALKMRRALEAKAVAEADRVVVLSEYMKGLLREIHGCPDEKIAVIPGGVDLKEFKKPSSIPETRGRLGIPKNAPVIFTLRRLVPRMGVDSLVLAMKTVLDKYPDAVLIVGGRGPERENLEKLAADAGVSKSIRFAGYIPAADAPDYYGCADCSVAPTRALEGFGLVLLESMACGTPALATPEGGMTEILRAADPSRLFASKSPEDIAGGIIRYLDSGGATAAVRASARAFAEKFSWSRAAGRFLDILSDVRQNEFQQ
jgi:glycosyltransferase involved in cell wall biosynthesis